MDPRKIKESPGTREWMCVLALPFGYFFTARSRKPGSSELKKISLYHLKD